MDESLLPIEGVYYLNLRFGGHLPVNMYDMPADQMDLILRVQADAESDFPLK